MKQKSTVLVIRVEPEVHKRLQQRAESEERSQATLIRKAIREFLENKSVVSQPGSLDNAFVGTN